MTNGGWKIDGPLLTTWSAKHCEATVSSSLPVALSRLTRNAWGGRMFDLVAQNLDPGMFPVLVDRKFRLRKVAICKSAERNGSDAGPPLNSVGHCRAAIGTETIGGSVPAVSRPARCVGTAAQNDLWIRPSRLRRKGATAPLLAIEAMANRHANRRAGARCLQLSAAAGCDARLPCHRRILTYGKRAPKGSFAKRAELATKLTV